MVKRRKMLPAPGPAIRTSTTAKLSELSRWDRFLIRVAPQWGLKRVKARAMARLIVEGEARHFEAADPGGRRTEGWNRSPTDVNTAQAPAVVLLREYARELKRNNGWARRALKVIANDTIGWGIRPTAVADTPEAASRANAVWREWADTPQCDYLGRLPFAGLQRLMMEAIAESGGVLVRRHVRGTEGMRLPLRLHVLEDDYLDFRRDGLWGEQDGPIIQGVELDAEGRRCAYWLFDQHPGAFRLYRHHWISRRVPADEVVHIFDMERPGAIRGVAWLAAAIARCHDLDEYDDAALARAKVAACFAGFVTDLEGLASPLGRPDVKENGDVVETLEPGMLTYLPPGKTITFGSPPQDPQQQGITASGLRKIAAAVGGLTYEDISLDFSQVNFSSARMARLTKNQYIHNWRWHMLIPQFHTLWRWAFEIAAVCELVAEVPGAKWTPPPPPMIDPEKEGLAVQRNLRAGLQTHLEMAREQGHDPDEYFEEYAEGLRLLKSKGIVLDSDASQTTASGAPIPAATESPAPTAP